MSKRLVVPALVMLAGLVAHAADDAAALAAEKQKLLKQIAAVRTLIDSVKDPQDPERRKDESRLAAFLQALGDLTVRQEKTGPAPIDASKLDEQQLAQAGDEREKRKLSEQRDAEVKAVDKLQATIKALEKATAGEDVAKREKAQAELEAARLDVAVTDTSISALVRKSGQPVDKHAAEISRDAVAAVKAATDADVQADLNRTFLRKHGFAVNLGYGYIRDLSGYSPDLQVRYNFLHDLQVEDVTKDRVAKHSANRRRSAREKFADGHGFGTLVTDLSGWIGYPLQKFDNVERKVGARTFAAGTEKEAPLALGLALGIGNGHEFSSAISVNLGVAVFRNPAFKSSSFYTGVSVDAVLFKALLKAAAEASGK